MRDLGALWKEYQNNPDDDWAYEKRVLIDGVEYTEAQIINFTKQGGLVYDDFNIGVCASMNFNVNLRTKADAPVVPVEPPEPEYTGFSITVNSGADSSFILPTSGRLNNNRK